MFNAALFSAQSIYSRTRELMRFLSETRLSFVFGIVANESGNKADSTCIAFGYLQDGAKVRVGSISTQSWFDCGSEIVILSMDCNHEYRAEDQHDALRFLIQLSLSKGDWVQALDEMSGVVC
jgi:hypothetical protein